MVDQEGKSKLFISYDGHVGIGTLNPSTRLEVNGNISSQGRRGTYMTGQVPEDGNWYAITPKLNQCHAFEVIAKINKPSRGLHAMLHAFGLGIFKGAKSTIKSHAYYSSFRDKIGL